MTMFKQECYKLLIKRGFLFLMLLLMILNLVFTIVDLKESITLSPRSLIILEKYIEEFEGEVTDDKLERIKIVKSKIETIYTKREEVREAYKHNIISKQEYEEQITKIRKYESETEGINAFLKIVDLAWKNETDIMDNTGWNVLMQSDSIDIETVIIVILLVILLCTYDMETGMDYIKLSTINGKATLIKIQLTIIVSFTFFIGLFMGTARYLIVDLVYGLDGHRYCLQNILGFEQSTKEISIISAYIILNLIKTFGLIFLGLTTYVMGIFLSSSLYTVFFSFVLTYIPAYILNNKRLLYLLPFPSAMLMGKGWFVSLISDEETNFVEITTTEMFTYLVLMLIIIVLVTIISIRYKLKGKTK